MRIDQSGNVDITGKLGIGTSTPQANLEINGYTMLGSGAPKIQMKKLTGTTPATQGGTALIAHGLDQSKILSVDVLVEYSSTNYIHYAYRESAGYEFNFYISGGNLIIVNVNGNSANILSKPFRVLINYEQ